MKYLSSMMILVLTSALVYSLAGAFSIKAEMHKLNNDLKGPFPEKSNITLYINNESNSSEHQSFAGSVAVREYGASIFYQLYSPKGLPIDDQTAPLILWLQGGPGCSSLIGNYQEMGPYFAVNVTNGNKTETKLKSNPNSWSNIAHMLFVEQPIGVGFSQLENYTIPNSTYSVAKDFETFLVKFFSLFPNYKNNDFYIFGESFGGHYIPGFASYIIQNSQTNNIKLSGIGIGDGWTDPLRQLTTFSSYAYSIGIISNGRKQWVKSQEARVSDLIYSGKFNETSGVFDNMTGVGDAQYPNSIVTKSGDAVVYNFRQYMNNSDTSVSTVQVFLNSNETLQAFGLNNSNLTWSQCNDQMYNNFYPDISKTFKQNISYLLNRTRVLLYNGQDDIIVNTPGAQNWINTLSWSGIKQWQQSKKQIWNLGANNTVGTVRKFSNLSVATVYKAGHLVPQDQGPSSLDMLRRWLSNQDNWNN